MEVLGTLADAPTAAIAVIAIGLGLLFAARGPRGERRPGGGTDEVAPVMLADVPVATPASDPGFVGPEGSIVGHGPIHLRGGGPPGEAPPQAAASPEPVREPEPEPSREPGLPPEPVPGPIPQPEPQPVPFRQGTIKLRSRPADEPPADR